MAIVMGIVTFIRLTRNMPRKVTEAALHGSLVDYDGNIIKAPAISIDDQMALMKRMADIEEKVKAVAGAVLYSFLDGEVWRRLMAGQSCLKLRRDSRWRAFKILL
ncbi:hypothetical protein SESBI_01649 [Sesbania bispinosa]|nr:hypothetical protein SESBI_01649 [Sesbania bispinosa]